MKYKTFPCPILKISSNLPLLQLQNENLYFVCQEFNSPHIGPSPLWFHPYDDFKSFPTYTVPQFPYKYDNYDKTTLCLVFIWPQGYQEPGNKVWVWTMILAILNVVF